MRSFLPNSRDEPPPATPLTGILTGDISSVGGLAFTEDLNAFPATLDLSHFRALPNVVGYTPDDALKCFGAGSFDRNDSQYEGLFAVQRKQNQRNFGQISFVFDAQGADGRTVSYGLHIFGTVVGNLPPEVSTRIFGSPGTFDIRHSNGPGNTVACIGEGFLSYSLLIVRN